jgi:hypothetical protein
MWTEASEIMTKRNLYPLYVDALGEVQNSIPNSIKIATPDIHQI